MDSVFSRDLPYKTTSDKLKNILSAYIYNNTDVELTVLFLDVHMDSARADTRSYVEKQRGWQRKLQLFGNRSRDSIAAEHSVAYLLQAGQPERHIFEVTLDWLIVGFNAPT